VSKKRRYTPVRTQTRYVQTGTVRQQLFEMRQIMAKYRFAIQNCRSHVWGCSYSYTVGLTAQELPELFIAGLPAAASSHVLAEVAGQSLKQPFHSGDTWPVPEDYRAHPDALLRLCAVEEVPEASLVLAQSMYKSKFRILQLVWPDPECRYPETEGWSDGESRQPLLPPSSRPIPMGLTRWTREE
jgi:hypothetical protein